MSIHVDWFHAREVVITSGDRSTLGEAVAADLPATEFALVDHAVQLGANGNVVVLHGSRDELVSVLADALSAIRAT